MTSFPEHDLTRFVGTGPAQRACLEAMQVFSAGWSAGLEPPPDVFDPIRDEGRGARSFAHFRDLRAVTSQTPSIRRVFVCTGCGVAMSWLGVRPPQDHPWRAPLADGYGFGLAVTRSRRTFAERVVPESDAAWREGFLHGVGRAAWYVSAGDPATLRALLRDWNEVWLWRGLGFAMGFAPEVLDEVLPRVGRVRGADMEALWDGGLAAALVRRLGPLGGLRSCFGDALSADVQRESQLRERVARTYSRGLDALGSAS